MRVSITSSGSVYYFCEDVFFFSGQKWVDMETPSPSLASAPCPCLPHFIQ